MTEFPLDGMWYSYSYEEHEFLNSCLSSILSSYVISECTSGEYEGGRSYSTFVTRNPLQ